MNIIGRTKSPCPACGRALGADLVEKDGAVFMSKRCPAHGLFEPKVAGHAWYYRGLDEFYGSVLGAGAKPLCTSQYTITLPGACGLGCASCPSAAGTAPAPSTAFIRKELRKLRGRGVDVNFSGGEPLLREDLAELVAQVKASGNQPTVITAAETIAADPDLLARLRDAGLKAVHLTVNRLAAAKAREAAALAMANLRRLGVPARIVTIVAGASGAAGLKAVAGLARKEPLVYSHYISAFRLLGDCNYSGADEFSVDELADLAGRATGLFTLEEVYLSKLFLVALAQALGLDHAPYCRQTAMIYVPRSGRKRFGELFRPAVFLPKLDKFRRLWPVKRDLAAAYFKAEFLPRPGCDPDLAGFYNSLGQMLPGRYTPPPYADYYAVLLAGSNPAAAYDIEKNRRECTDRGFNSGVGGNVPHCLEMMGRPSGRVKKA